MTTFIMIFLLINLLSVAYFGCSHATRDDKWIDELEEVCGDE